jgi:hypothetical protein
VILSSPGFLLAGVLATAVPLAIFLLWRHRRRPVRWAAMRFLLEAEQARRRRRRLERLLLMAIRCLLLVLLGAALARPLLEGGGVVAGGRRTVVLVIDDAMTSGLRDDAGDATVLARHVATARELIASLTSGDRVGVVRASRSGPDLLPPSADLESVGRWLESLESAAVRADLPAALRVAAAAAGESLDAGSDASVHLLSEFRTGTLDPEDAPPSLGLPESVGLFAMDPAADVRSNAAVVGIDAVRSVIVPGAADGSGQVSVRLRRHGELDAAESRVRVDVPGLRAIEPRTVAWTPGQTEASVDVRLPVEIDGVGGTSRPLVVTASIDADALPVDDARSVVLEAAPSLRIALLDRRGFGRDGAIDRIGAGGWLERALDPGEGASMDLVRLEPAALSGADLRGVVAAVVPRPDLLRTEGWRHLANFARRGGLVLLSPPEDAVVHGWLDELDASFAIDWRIERETQVLPEPMGLMPPRRIPPLLGLLAGELEDLLRPVLVDRRLVIAPGERTETILAAEDGSPWMLAAWAGSETDDATVATDPGGLVVLMASAPMLEWTNLPTKPLMVPMVQETMRQGIGLARSASRPRVGERPRLVRLPAADRLEDPAGVLIPIAADGRPVDPLTRPGVHRVLDSAGAGIGVLAVGVDAAGGRTETQAAEAVSAWLGRSGRWQTMTAADPAASLRTAPARAGLDRTLLLLLAVLLILESLLARRFSRIVGGRDAAGVPAGSILPTLAQRSAGDRAEARA